MTTMVDAAADAAQRVRAFLAAMEARDLAQAESFLAPGFRMVFPGNAAFGRLADLVARSGTRYRFVRKTFARVDTAPAADGTAVTCFGTLSGEYPDGTAFAGIRFCDWFLVGKDGKLLRQEVWNDMGEMRRGG